MRKEKGLSRSVSLRPSRFLAIERLATVRKPFDRVRTDANEIENRSGARCLNQRGEGKAQAMNGEAVLENVRRYRAIASLYRQTAAFRPGQSWSLLDQARDWERRALSELEAYFARMQQTCVQVEMGVAPLRFNAASSWAARPLPSPTDATTASFGCSNGSAAKPIRVSVASGRSSSDLPAKK
jgi:hypothetical protein